MGIRERLAKADKTKLRHGARNIFFVLLGSAVLAFGGAVFLTPFDIVSGGAVTVSIIVSHFIGDAAMVSDIVVAAVQVFFFLLGLFTLGKKFAAKTLLATVAYPLFYALFYRLGIGSQVTDALAEYLAEEELMVYFLAGLFGGFFVGTGVALTFLGNGSTGGFDVLILLIAKYTPLKQGMASFLVDATTIIVGLICLQNYAVTMIGIISALVAALMIQFIYVDGDSCLVMDIITAKPDEVSSYIHEELDHATTEIEAYGGYTGEKRRMVRAVIYRRERQALMDFIASVDLHAFVIYSAAKASGEGFESFRRRKKREAAEAKEEKEGKGEEANG